MKWVCVCVCVCVCARASVWSEQRGGETFAFRNGHIHTHTHAHTHTHTVELPSTAAVCDIDGVRTLEEMQIARGGARCADVGGE
jgi:hypothetical protein